MPAYYDFLIQHIIYYAHLIMILQSRMLATRPQGLLIPNEQLLSIVNFLNETIWICANKWLIVK